MVQSDYTTADELKFVKGMGLKHKDQRKNFSTCHTPRKVLLERYMQANINRRVDVNHKGHPAINFYKIFSYIRNELSAGVL